MKTENTARAPRGRPPSITREKIAAAGITLGLPHLTFVGVAETLGVSHMALYKHISSLEALKQLVAEEIFTRWEFLPPSGDIPLVDYLGGFVASLRALVKAHPGLPAHLMRPSAASKRMLDKIDTHHRSVARAFALSQSQARWLLSTIAFHCIAVADMVYTVSAGGKASDAETDNVAPPPQAAKRKRDEAVMQREFTRGMHALIIGALHLLGKGDHTA